MATDMRRKEQLPDLTDRIVASYLDIGTMNHLGHCPLPSPDAMVEIAQDLKDVIFPGYRRRQNLHMGNVMYHVGDLMDGLHDKLTTQIARALSHAYDLEHGLQCEKKRHIDFEAQGQEKALAFLDTLPNLRKKLAADVQAAYDGDPAAASLDEIIFCYPGLEAVTIYRIAHELNHFGRSADSPHAQRMVPREHGHRHSSRCPDRAFVLHRPRHRRRHRRDLPDRRPCENLPGRDLGGFELRERRRRQSDPRPKRHPTIEENVVIYSNATVLGGDTIIGRNSVIGASVSLSKSVPPNTVVTIEKPTLRFREAS